MHMAASAMGICSNFVRATGSTIQVVAVALAASVIEGEDHGLHASPSRRKAGQRAAGARIAISSDRKSVV